MSNIIKRCLLSVSSAFSRTKKKRRKKVDGPDAAHLLLMSTVGFAIFLFLVAATASPPSPPPPLVPSYSLPANVGCPATFALRQFDNSSGPANLSSPANSSLPAESAEKDDLVKYREMKEYWRLVLDDVSEFEKVAKCEAKDFSIPRATNDDPDWPEVSLAFSVVTHHNLAILTRLLRLLFRPRHAFCLYIDAKASEAFRNAVSNLVDCYRKLYPGARMILAPNARNIYWGHISLLRADLACLELLFSKFSEWKYFLNLAGAELPRFSTERLEKEVSSLKGQSMVVSYRMPLQHTERQKFVYRLRKRKRIKGFYNMIPDRTTTRKHPPPFPLVMYKGLKNVVLNRTFSEFLLRSRVSKTFLHWLRDTFVPDETFFSTLVRIHVSKGGSVRQDLLPETLPPMFPGQVLPRHTVWVSPGVDPRSLCRGRVVRDICNFSVFDLPSLAQLRHHLFLNKFDVETDALAVQCWTERVVLQGD